MELVGVTYEGPELDNEKMLTKLPESMQNLLQQINGFILFQGGLHVRGICSEPDWHSIQSAWFGECAFHIFYSNINKKDIPFAQDCVGDQFFLRKEEVIRLNAEDGSIEHLGVDFITFLKTANADPVEYLTLEPLLQFHNEGKVLEPGQLIHVYPPFCTVESGNGISMAAIPVAEVLHFHAKFSAGVLSSNGRVEVKIID